MAFTRYPQRSVKNRLFITAEDLSIPAKMTVKLVKYVYEFIKDHRRIATRYEKLAVTFLGVIQFATATTTPR